MTKSFPGFPKNLSFGNPGLKKVKNQVQHYDAIFRVKKKLQKKKKKITLYMIES